jgi:hypothetical protein
VRVLAAVQAAQRDAPGRGVVSLRVDLAGEPGRQLFDRLAVGPRPAGRRHQAAAQLTDRELPGFRVGGNSVGRQAIERPPTGHIVAVVAFDAVFFDDGPLLLGGMGLCPPIGPAAEGGDGTDERYGYDDLR